MFSPSWIYEHIEQPFILPLGRIMSRGVGVHRERLRELYEDLGKELAERQEVWLNLSGGVNPDSRPQLSKYLEGLGLPLVKRTESGKLWSTSRETLEDLPQHPHIDALLAISEVDNLKSLAKGYLEAVREDGRIYSQVNPVGAQTGRMSNFDPNLMQIPKAQGEKDSERYAWGKRFRLCIVPAPGHVIIKADWNAMEMRMVTNLSGDVIFTKLFRSGGDPHLDTEQRVFKTQNVRRREAKVINFGVLYLEGANKFARQIGCTVAEAKQLIGAFFLEHKELKNWQDQEIEKARLRGWVETYFGRRRYVRLWKEGTPREVVNMPVQGTCADVMKLAIIGLPDAPIVLPVHDELVLEVKEKEAERLMAQVGHVMETRVRMSVPLTVEVKQGPSWGECE